METENEKGQAQVHFKTKQEQYGVPDVPYSIDATVTTTELNTSSIRCYSRQLLRITLEMLNSILLCSMKIPSSGAEPQDCLLHDDWVSAVKTSGKWVLTGCYDNTVNIWTHKGKHILTIPGHSMPVKAVAWVSLDEERGKFVTCSQDQTAMLWDWLIQSNSVECVSVCKGHERGIDCVDVSPNKQRFATGAWDTMLKIWSADINEVGEGTSKRAKVDAGSTRTPQMTLQGHRECISAVQWIDDNTLLTGSWDHTLKIWDLNMEGIKAEISANKSIFDASYSNLNRLIVTASADKNLRLYDARTNQGSVVRNTYLGHQQWVQTVMWSTTEEYLFVSGSYDNQNKLWDCRSPKAPLYDLLGHGDKVLDIDWSNPKYIVSGGADNTVRVYKSRKALAAIIKWKPNK
ncbi:hypothetical protein DOY81_009906 [Sarcophaga bullata]|nr:hypothetical protein DOY81_009906 [Sarcophaga bullata]